jgi:hypothetical protein
VNRLIKIVTSLRLTVTLLAFGIVLVFVGTVAQADEGLYQAQARYFKHWFVWSISLFGHKVPLPLPGGYLIGTLLLINLTAAHIQRFQWTWKKAGIHLTHVGIVLLLVGQLATDLLSRETQLRFVEGETKSWSESAMDYELAFLSDLDATNDQVVAIPASLLAQGGAIIHDKLPFTLRVTHYWPNSEPTFRAPMQQNAPPLTTNGIGRNFDFRELHPTRKMDDKNVPTAVLELAAAGESPGTWVVSGWAGDETMVFGLRRYYAENMGPQVASSIISRLTEPQSIEAGGKKFTFTLRPVRAYKPFALTLLKATHAVYPGTDKPKDFRSRVRIQNATQGEDREVEIYMNNPLRYAGLTFFQQQMSRVGESPWSTLQVVRNPGWITPYAGCIIVAAGLVFQFMIHLVGFVSKRAKA